jgi:hypothetical protein
MKKILLPMFILTLSTLKAQTGITIDRIVTIPYIDPRPPHMKGVANILILSSGDTIHLGSVLTLGKGSLPNGDYNYIATPSNTIQAKLKRTNTLKEVKVIELSRKGKEKYGYRYYVKVEGGYLIQLEDAIATGEILFDHNVQSINNKTKESGG